MVRRSPARYLAPLALVAVVVALGLIVSSSPPGGEDDAPRTSPTAGRTEGAPSRERRRPGRRARRAGTYRVAPGDTLQGIAEKTGVEVDVLRQLNPDVDPQALTVGQRIRLRS